VSDVAAVTEPRRETRWNLLGCPKLTNRSQPSVDQSSPRCGTCGGYIAAVEQAFFRLSIVP